MTAESSHSPVSDVRRCVIVGAGAWGLPAATELARRGHEVHLVDRWGAAHALSSSPGPTRIWRITHADAVRVRLAKRSLEAMERLQRDSGREVFLRQGILWRDGEALDLVEEALRGEDVAHERVEAEEVRTWFPGLRPDGRSAIWQSDAGPVLARSSMDAQYELFSRRGGSSHFGAEVVGVETRRSSVLVRLSSGEELEADQLLIAPGASAAQFLGMLGITLPMWPVLQQVVHFGGSEDAALPCFYDGVRDGEPSLYAMGTPGTGYKLGMDRALRALVPTDLDRTPSAAVTEQLRQRVVRDFTQLDARVLDAQVCSWTESPDGRFVIDRVNDHIVLACADNGQGFKFSALMGLVLADLVEGRPVDADIATFGLERFAGMTEFPPPPGI